MERKQGKCWKLPIFKGKLWGFFSVIWVKWKHSVCSITLPYSSTFYSLFLPFFVLEIFKFKYNKFFVRHSVSISKFEWFEQPCIRSYLGCPKWPRMMVYIFIYFGVIFFRNLPPYFKYSENWVIFVIFGVFFQFFFVYWDWNGLLYRYLKELEAKAIFSE